jgi:hypothetical protein
LTGGRSRLRGPEPRSKELIGSVDQVHLHGSLLLQLNAPAPCSRQKDRHSADLWNDLAGVAEGASGRMGGVAMKLIVDHPHMLPPNLAVYFSYTPISSRVSRIAIHGLSSNAIKAKPFYDAVRNRRINPCSWLSTT